MKLSVAGVTLSTDKISLIRKKRRSVFNKNIQGRERTSHNKVKAVWFINGKVLKPRMNTTDSIRKTKRISKLGASCDFLANRIKKSHLIWTSTRQWNTRETTTGTHVKQSRRDI